LSLHTFGVGGELVTLACNDDDVMPFTDSRISWSAQAGTPYFLRVAGKNGATGVYLLDGYTFVTDTPPANAFPEFPLSIWPGDYHGFTREAGGPPSLCQTEGESVWYEYEPKASGIAVVNTYLFAYFDTAVDIEEDGVIIRCADSSGSGEIVTFPVVAGARYLIRVGKAGPFAGVFGMRFEGPECFGRTCDDPETIEGGQHLVSLVGATPAGSSNEDPARYFRYVAMADGTLNVRTCGTTAAAVQGYAVGTRLSLHAACPADPSTELDCGETSLLCSEGFRPQPFVSTPVSQGQEVLIRLSARADGQLTPILMEVELAQPLSVCFGDGSGTACPCGNSGALQRGCDNSFGAGGARLYATGTASLSADTLTLAVTDAPQTAPILLLQGDANLNAGAGAPFADGLLCIDGTTLRLAGAISMDGASIFGALGGKSLSIIGGIPPAGSTRWYQGYYRNAAAFCTAAQANLTNAVRVTWVP
jgi:hypothetical protein